MERTQEEIQKQIAGLKAMKLRMPEFSGFGDPNHKAIDAQLDILEGKQDMDYFEDTDNFDDDSEWSHIRSEAENAQMWLDGERAEDLFE